MRNETTGRRHAALAAAPLALLAALSVGCSERADNKKPEKPKAPPVEVGVARPQFREVDRHVDMVGTVFADEEVTVPAKVAGRLVAMKFDIGDTVASGQPLGQVETSDYQLAVEQKQMAVREALGKIGLAELPKGELDVAAVPQVRRARFQADNASARFQRAKQLYDQQPPRISEQEFGDIRTTYEVAKNDLDIEALTARAALDQARTRQAELNTARRLLADTEFFAPAGDGDSKRRFLVSAKIASVGEYAHEGAPVYRLIDIDTVKVRALVPERFLTVVKIGQKSRVFAEAYPTPFEGTLSRINPQIDPASRNFQVEVDVPNQDHRLKPGSFVRVSILTQRDPRAVFIPRSAVTVFAGLTKAFTIDNGRAREALLTLGEGDAEWVEVVSGLKGEETLAVGGGTKLTSGSEVTIVAATQPATRPAAEKPAR